MNIAKLNTVSLDDKTFIIKRGTSGGGTPINNQDKVVDITENGSVEVVPDAGYTGLAKVTANVNVSGGGGELSPDAEVYEPNGWYWKWAEGTPSDFSGGALTLLMLFEAGIKYDSCITAYIPKLTGLRLCDDATIVGLQIGRMEHTTDEDGICILAVSESKYIHYEVDDTTTIAANSLYELICILEGTRPEFDFVSVIGTNFGLQRITKEEYESLITA